MKDDSELAQRVKALEGVETKRKGPVDHPIIVRLDGRAFHTFTRGLERPFDLGLRALMVETMKACIQECNALIGHTQSDEISLVIRPNREIDGKDDPTYFGGRFQKIATILASTATAAFNYSLPIYLPRKERMNLRQLPIFDARCWAVPTEKDACEVISWREMDSRVNAVAMVAQANFSASQLEGVSCQEMKVMLAEKGIKYSDVAVNLRRGVYYQRVARNTPFTAEEIEALPPQHNARKDPSLMVSRSLLAEVDLPPFCNILNPEDVVFRGLEPIVQSYADPIESFDPNPVPAE